MTKKEELGPYGKIAALTLTAMVVGMGFAAGVSIVTWSLPIKIEVDLTTTCRDLADDSG